jgi:hypothetical protein
MTIKNLVDQVADSDVSLYKSLLVAKVIASRLKNEKLLEWTNLELKGYGDENGGAVPRYRVVKLVTTCTLSLGDDVRYGIAFPIVLLGDDKVRLSLTSENVKEGISPLETHLKSTNPDKFYGNKLSLGMAAILTQIIQQAGNNVKVSDVVTQVPISELDALVAGARNVLLELLLEIEDEFPDLPEVGELTNETRESVNQIINVYMAENGVVTVAGTSFFAKGTNNSITANVGTANEINQTNSK